jgi:hypothetical protein
LHLKYILQPPPCELILPLHVAVTSESVSVTVIVAVVWEAAGMMVEHKTQMANKTQGSSFLTRDSFLHKAVLLNKIGRKTSHQKN